MRIDNGKLLTIIRSKFFENGMWLYFLQLFNTLIPMLTLPYITRILGPSQYGVFSSALNLVGYLQVLVEYGFNLSGTRKAALAEDKRELSKIYSKILFSKFLLLLISFFAMLLILTLLDVSVIQKQVVYLLFLIVIGSALQQIWLFQGLQEMKYITIISVISRTISVSMIFLFVKDKNDVLLYSLLYSITMLLIGMLSIILIKYRIKIQISIITTKEIISELKDSWYLFNTTAMSRIFSSISITVLTLTSTENNVGIYSAIQKIPIILSMLFAPIGQVLFPYISQKYSLSFENGLNTVKKIMIYIVSGFSLLGMIIIIFSKKIIQILYGDQYSNYHLLIVPLVLWLILSIINNILGIQILVASGHQNLYSRAFNYGVVFMIISNIVLGSMYGMYGVAIAVMLAELLLAVVMLYYINKLCKNNIGRI